MTDQISSKSNHPYTQSGSTTATKTVPMRNTTMNPNPHPTKNIQPHQLRTKMRKSNPPDPPGLKSMQNWTNWTSWTMPGLMRFGF